MKGFDRPLKPTWIYRFAKKVEIGDKLSDHRKEFDDILWELDGKEGKRKVRTVLSRYFLKSQENPKSRTVEDNPMIRICKSYSLERIKPLLLYHLLMRSSMIQTLTKMIYKMYGTQKDIDYRFMRKKVIDRFGERDISSRSLRNLLHTLVHFDVLEKNKNRYTWKRLLETDELNTCYMIKFYSEIFKNSPQIKLDNIEDYLFLYFKIPDLYELAAKYNNTLWQYTVRLNRNIITFSKEYTWDEKTLAEVFKK